MLWLKHQALPAASQEEMLPEDRDAAHACEPRQQQEAGRAMVPLSPCPEPQLREAVSAVPQKKPCVDESPEIHFVGITDQTFR